MPKLIFVNRFFFPDHSATSQILSDLTFDLARRGREVHVVASRQSYENPNATLAAEEIVDGVHIHRVASTRFGRAALAGRALDYLSFYHSARRQLSRLTSQSDIAIVKTDPPLLSVAAITPVSRNGARLVNWLQDIYPETAVVLNVPLMRGPIGSALAGWRNRSLRRATANVVVGERMAETAIRSGAEAKRVHVIANWCDDEAIRPLPSADNPLRSQWQLEDKFVIGYSGNLGRAHDHDTILAAAERLRSDPRLVFLMIGGGSGFENLAVKAKERGVDAMFRFMPYQPRTILRHSLGVADVHWLSLNPRLSGLLLPSKFYGIAAAGRPMIFIGAKNDEIADLIARYGCGLAVAPGEVDALVETLQRWSKSPQALDGMGQRARAMLEARFRRRQALERWSTLLDRLD